MPARAPKPCRKASCPNLCRDSTGYCVEHKALASGWTHQDRGSTTERGYGYKWQKIRRSIMERDRKLCQQCYRAGRLTMASDVDHILPKAKGGTDDRSNLEAICKHCHRLKTAREHVG